jgi:hypothetical protein
MRERVASSNGELRRLLGVRIPLATSEDEPAPTHERFAVAKMHRETLARAFELWNIAQIEQPTCA